MVNPILQSTLEDVDLLYEFLLAGLEIDRHAKLSIKDEELSSLRKAKKFDVICHDIIPKNITDIRRLTTMLSRYPGVLQRKDFERTVLTMVYTAYRAISAGGYQRDFWAESFVNLYQAIKQDLMH
ncbi:protein FAM180A [Latimeria chalumnae]|uniref:protein FAM180A n=1 Tax=Latimeria chalumnae TaxID=7897 RepID=UPI00313D3C48